MKTASFFKLKTTRSHIDLVETKSAHNYAPLPVVIARGEGCWVEDVEGERYLDFLSAYSALNFGHGHPDILEVFLRQARTLTLTSRAFHNDQFGPFCETHHRPCVAWTCVLPMNTGAEGGGDGDQDGPQVGLHGEGRPARPGGDHLPAPRTSTDARSRSMSFSTDESADRRVRSDDARLPAHSLRRRGRLRGGDHAKHRRLPRGADPGRGRHQHPAGRLPGEAAVRCAPAQQRPVHGRRDPDRPGPHGQAVSPVDHENVRPDVVILGKALGGGMMPVSAVLAIEGDHERVSRPAITAAPLAATRSRAPWPWPPSTSSNATQLAGSVR